VEKVLNRFDYKDIKPSPRPYDRSLILRKDKRIGRDQLRYSQIIGLLMYLASASRHDISFVVNKLIRFTSNLGNDHWCAIERVMYYLTCTIDYRIHYSEYPAVLEGYNDERLRPDLPRGRGKSISGDLNVDVEGSEQNVEPLQSLHHGVVGYQSVHTQIDLMKKANPSKCNREHKQEHRKSNRNYG
jgi:hypothetical protein